MSNYSFPKLTAGSPENGAKNEIFEIPNLETNHFQMKHASSGPIHHLPSCDNVSPPMKTGPVNEDGNLSIGIRIVNSTIKGIPWEFFGMELGLNGLDRFIYKYIYICIYIYMGVSKNSGTPKWMVYNGTFY